MNNLKSYTEYAVTSNTTDFVIGFDFNYGTDAVNVTVDGVPATDVGYTVVYLNSTTMRLTPAVPIGVVRLQRETDIDVPDNSFTAGAKFIASNMDENFTQIRHAQQEVRDSFNFLESHTLGVVEAAKDATIRANNVASEVEGLLDVELDHNDLHGRDEVGAHPASAILDASGVSQQEINAYRTYTLDDFSGVDDSEKLTNAFAFFADRGGRLILNPREHLFTSLVESGISKKIDIYAVGAVIKTDLSTLVIDMKDTSFSWVGGEFNAVGKAKVSTNIFVKSSGADSVDLTGIEFNTVNYGFNIDNVKSFSQSKCKGKGARYWNVYLKTFESAVIDGNDMRSNEYDGIKVGSDDISGPQNYAKKLIITNNTGGGNTRDLIDFAVNNCELVVVTNNISDDDVLRCVDAKIVYQSTSGLKNLIIAGNTGKRSSNTVDQTFINIQGLGGVASVEKGLVVNNIAECLGSSMSAMIRIADANNIKVSNNDSDGFYYFTRLTGGSSNNLIKNNTAVKCVHFIQSQALEGRIPSSNKVCYNDAVCQGHLSGLSSAFAYLDSANLTEFFENEYSVVNSAYPITYEANGAAATNTKVGKNYRGFTDSPPLGVRAIVNDTWRSAGDVTEYVCNTQTASTTLAQLTKVSNKSTEVGSTTATTSASGIINLYHTLGKIPTAVVATVAGDNQYSVKEVGKSSAAVSFKVFNAGAALASTEVTLSYVIS